MLNEFNIYCDESCHLPHDKSKIMVIGGVSCPKKKAATINKAIFDIKEKYNVYKYSEIKWTKVSNSRYEMYRSLIDLFFDNNFLNFRAVVALNKDKLNYEKFNLSHDDWYQRIYYLLLREMLEVGKQYHIYVDIKDTKGAAKINTLKNVLNNTTAYFYDETVNNIQLLRSDQVHLIQLTDLLIGAVSYANRGLNGNSAKLKLIKHIENYISRSLTTKSPKTESKFNIFLWTPREV